MVPGMFLMQFAQGQMAIAQAHVRRKHSPRLRQREWPPNQAWRGLVRRSPAPEPARPDADDAEATPRRCSRRCRLRRPEKVGSADYTDIERSAGPISLSCLALPRLFALSCLDSSRSPHQHVPELPRIAVSMSSGNSPGRSVSGVQSV